MIDFGIWQGHLSPAIRPAHRRQAGDRRKATLSQKLLTKVSNGLQFLMLTILKSDVFEYWIDNLRDRSGVVPSR